MDDGLDEHDIYRQELARQIEMVFADMPYPGDDKIVTNPNSSLSYQLLSLFGGRQWKEIPFDVIVQEKLALPLFTAEGFRFYLPAFIRAALLYPNQVDILPSNIINMLAPPAAEDTQMQDFLNRIDGFTQEQTGVIKAYVKSYATIEHTYRDSVRDRASRFWEQKE